MSTQRASAPSLREIYPGWGDYHAKIIGAVARLDAEQLGLSAAPGLWPVRMLVSHIVSARKWWFHDWMGDGDAEWDQYDGWDDLEAKFTRPTPNAAGERPVRARGWIVCHVAEHDVYHGAEISLTLGMHGLRGLDL